MNKNKGFTLIELLLVITVIGVLAVSVFVALNPAERLGDTRNARRGQDINQILTAINECIIDDESSSLANCIGPFVAGNTYEIVTGGVSTGCSSACAATNDVSCLSLDLTLGSYMANIPSDPGGVDVGHTEYAITIDSNDLVTISSCSAEGTVIQASR